MNDNNLKTLDARATALGLQLRIDTLYGGQVCYMLDVARPDKSLVCFEVFTDAQKLAQALDEWHQGAQNRYCVFHKYAQLNRLIAA